ncbi:MAG: hypothetical protein NWR72_16650 [Bacteroidia bacterium]|nr:hypothetical protein [Bacteroidia bacterium]
MAHTAHLLRPVFTRRLAQQLTQGAVLNLAGREADGVSRLLDDLMGMEVADLRILQVDMREFVNGADGFVKGISQALGFEEPAQDFEEWVDALQLHGGKLCLILHHFDAVERGESYGYGEAFFATLNRFFLIPNLSLIVVTEQPLEARLTDLDSFFAQSDFEPELHKLPPLGFKRYQEELHRQFPAWKPDPAIIMAIFSHPTPYPFFEYVLTRLHSLGQASPQVSEKVLKNWRADFDGK